LKLLGTEGVDESEIDDLPKIVADLVEEGPFFFFNTWAPDDSQNAFVFIQGLAEDYEDTEDTEDVEDVEDVEEPDDEPEDDEDAEDDEGKDEDADSEDDEGEDAEDAEEEEWEPEKEDVYLFKASPRCKPKEVEVLSVNRKARTVTVKRSEDGKKFSKVSWDKLEGADE
jgi:hypothetical protein